MKTVVTCNNLSEVSIVRSLLEAEGIDVLVPQENTPQPLAGFPIGYHIQVPDDVSARAEDILNASGYGPKVPVTTNASPTPANRKVVVFRWLLFVDAVLAIGIWINAQRVATSIPPAVQNYLESLAANIELWDLGYSVFMVGFSVNLVGSLLLFFRTRTGLWLYAGGLLLQAFWMWVFPGGVSYGLASVAGTLELVLAGFIIGFATFEKSILTP